MRLKSSVIIFMISISVLILAGLAAFFDHQGFSLKLFTLSFWLILFGTFLYLREIKSEK